MAGVNKIIKKGQLVFKAGDKSDGMYLIRKGELCVYLEQDGKEVVLAAVGEGGMIGEMALFDNQPRSASVRATSEAEVTLISTEDFGKLMKQIPKWFVGLMSALSTRLRQTNERLKKLESGLSGPPGGGATGKPASPSRPFQVPIRLLNILNLIFNKDGTKEGKDWLLPRLPAEKQLSEIFGEDPAVVKNLFDLMVKEKVLLNRQDSYKNVALVLQNRAQLSQLATFMQQFTKVSPKEPFLRDSQLAMVKVLDEIVQSSPYDAVTVSLADLQKQARREAISCETWGEDIKIFANAGDEIRIVKVSSGVGLRTTKKDCSAALKHHEIMVALAKAHLI
jgi:hypothetical protein